MDWRLICTIFCLHSCTGSAQELREFPAPARLKLPMHIQSRQLFNVNPQEPYPRASSALTFPMITEKEPAVDTIMDDIKEGLRYVFQTRNELTLPIPGTGTTGMAAVLDNLIEPGDKVLVMSMGYWGDLMANISERLDANVVKWSRASGTRFSIMEVETALLIHRPKILAMVMGESDTGVRQPMDGIGDLATRYGAILVVDIVAVAGIQPILMDKLKMDAIFSSTNKGLGLVAGLAPLSLSARAVEKLRSRSTPPRFYPTDLLFQAQLWNTTDRSYEQTLTLPLMYSLREALATIAEERIENGFERHERATRQLSRGLEALDFQLFVPQPADRLVGVTAALPPSGKDLDKIIDFVFKNSNIAIAGGYGPTTAKVIRIATFAMNADSERVNKVLRALEYAIRSPQTNI